MSATTWAPSAPGEKYRLSRGPATSAETELAAVPSPADGAQDEGRLLSVGNPLLVFGALAALTFGLMAVSTTVRVGKTKASVSLGSTS